LDGREQPVTASVGVAIFGGGDSTAEELLERADQAMYAAKSQGGNTYRTSGPASFV
jgi:diguanylate cyclase (GGDEF)-like protein